MSLDFAVVRFSGVGTAVQRYAAAKARSRSDAGWAREIGFVEHASSGHLMLRGTFAGHYVDVDERDRVSQKGAGEGAAIGGIAGVLLGPPGIPIGLIVGALVGSHVGTADDAEAEPDLLADRLRTAVPRSSSAIVLIAASADVDEMLAALDAPEHDVARGTLNADEEAKLQASLSGAPPASSQQ